MCPAWFKWRFSNNLHVNSPPTLIICVLYNCLPTEFQAGKHWSIHSSPKPLVCHSRLSPWKVSWIHHQPASCSIFQHSPYSHFTLLNIFQIPCFGRAVNKIQLLRPSLESLNPLNHIFAISLELRVNLHDLSLLTCEMGVRAQPHRVVVRIKGADVCKEPRT